MRRWGSRDRVVGGRLREEYDSLDRTQLIIIFPSFDWPPANLDFSLETVVGFVEVGTVVLV